MRLTRPVILALFVASTLQLHVHAQDAIEHASVELLVDPLTADHFEVTGADSEDPESVDRNWLVEIVDLIRNDPAKAGLDAADWWCSPFDTLLAPPPEFAEEAEELEDFLCSFVRTSTDDWLVDRVAVSMAACAEPGWSPLFLDLLNHPSTQLRWRAVQHFSDVADENAVPALEALWNDELPPWIRTDLAYALLENGSNEHVEDCVDLVDADDVDLARAAVYTLRETRPEGALEALVRHARQEDSWLREDAVEALAGWPEDPQVMRLLVDLSRSGPATIGAAATSSLSSFSQREALDRLVEVALDTTAGLLPRLDALGALTVSDHPDLIQVLQRVLDEPATEDGVVLKRTAHRGLSSLGIEIPMLEPPPGETSGTFTISCSFGAIFDRPVLAVAGQDSVRCWAAPHIAGDPEEYERLEAGMPVRIDDHFQSGSEHWVQVEDESCWVPIEQLGEPSGSWESDPNWPYRQELDVPLAEVDSPMGQALRAAGMVRVFDIAETVAAIRFEIDPDDREEVGRLADLYVDDDSAMSYFVWVAMDELEDRYESDEELGRRIADALDE